MFEMSLLNLCLLGFQLITLANAEVQRLNMLLTAEDRTTEGFTRPEILPQVYEEDSFVPNNRLITGNKGDQFLINVQNQLTPTNPPMLQATSIHWHGIHQTNTSWADGGVAVTQCPIVPGQEFLYNFTVNQAGTFWYHSHYSVQYCDGLRGPMIIYDQNDLYKDLYDFDNETTIITLEDWWSNVSPAPLISGKPRWALINGLGRGLPPPGTPAAPPSDLAIINVSRDKRYRFRLVGMSCEAVFNFRIDNHTMHIIEVDGDYVNPVRVDSLWIHAGQRYSVVVKADQPPLNYWIRAGPLKGYEGFDGARNSAILHYLEAPEPTFNGTAVNGVLDDSFRSLHPLAEERLISPLTEVVPARVLGEPYETIEIIQVWNQTSKQFLINGQTFALPANFSVLLEILNGQYNEESIKSVITLESNKVYELRIRGVQQGKPHPMHLHGQSFYVVKTIDSVERNLKNPPLRDTVDTGEEGDTTVIRFVTDNPGPWFFHCHIDWHLDLGFAVVFAVDPKLTQQVQSNRLTNVQQVCDAYKQFPGDNALLEAIHSGGK